MAAIEVAVIVEEMHLEQHLGTTDGRPVADAGGPIAPDRATPLVDAGLDRIDTERRLQIVAEHEVGGGEAQLAAERLAMLDATLDLPGTAKQSCGLARTLGQQMLAHAGGGEHLARLAANGRHRGHAEAMQLAEIVKQLGIAAPTLAEDEI